MTAPTKVCPQARLGAPVYVTDHKPMTVLGIRAANTLAIDAAETLDMVVIPAGARIIDCVVWADAAGGCTEIDVGLYQRDEDFTVIDADGLIDAGDIQNTPFKATWTGKATELMVGCKQTYESVVRLTANAGNMADAVNVYCAVTYIMP